MTKLKLPNIFFYSLFFLLIFIAIFLVVCECNCENKRYIEENFISDPHIISPNRVNILMTFDEKYGEKIGNRTSQINKNYADEYGFNFHVNDYNTGILKPHYKRYFGILELFEKIPENDYVVYIDGDAVFLNTDKDLRKWFSNTDDTFVLLGNEINYVMGSKVISALRNILYKFSGNSGIIIIKNNDWTKKFIQNIINTGSREKGIDKLDQGTIDNLYYENKNDERKHIKSMSFKNGIQHHRGTIKKGFPSIINDDFLVLHTVSVDVPIVSDILYNKNERQFLKTIEPTRSPKVIKNIS
jgi:lipopolysaccharide biosynthesis glycosyltransferase